MNKQEIFEYLKDSLRVTLTNNSYIDSSKDIVIKSTIEVFLVNPDNDMEELISSDETTSYV